MILSPRLDQASRKFGTFFFDQNQENTLGLSFDEVYLLLHCPLKNFITFNFRI